MWIFWIAALLPIAFCGVMLFFNRKVSYVEWLITTAVALFMALSFQIGVHCGMTSDIETWSGQVTQAKQFSRWEEYYEKAIYRTETYLAPVTHTDAEGNSSTTLELRSREVFDHWEPKTRWHEASWKVSTTLGDWDIDGNKFVEISTRFNNNNPTPVAGDRSTFSHNSRMIGGDANDYVTVNTKGWVEPVTSTRVFKNKVKAAPSSFTFSKVPTNISVYPWPNTKDPFRSNRVLGTATNSINTLKWDQMNALLGPTKKVNLIIIGFGEQPPEIAKWQESAWLGGKKNDLVICYGNIKLEDEGSSVKWVKVFGWTESNKVKRNIEKILIGNQINDNLIPLIHNEVVANYVIKDWSKFDNLTVGPPTWTYWLYFGVMFIVQGILFFVYSRNELDQVDDATEGRLYNIGNVIRNNRWYIRFPWNRQ